MDFKAICFYLIERQGGRDRRRFPSSGFIPQMLTTARTEPGQSKETGTQFGSSTRVSGAQALEPLSAASQCEQ